MSNSVICDIKTVINNAILAPITIFGNVIERCGCMLSKWIVIEFIRIGGFEEFLFISIIYMEPFEPVDHINFAVKLTDMPQNILNLYNLASDCSDCSVDYDHVVLSIPYVCKNARTVIRKKICSCDAMIATSLLHSPADLASLGNCLAI